MSYHRSDKKKALQAYKEEILRDIKYFEKRIEEARSQNTNSSYFEEDDDSDSDDMFSLDMGPSITDLKLEQGRLQTCLHATQELTNLFVLQSEVNIMVNDPTYEREPPVSEQGTWREVTADCRVDLVPFSITFYAHQASRLFGATSYRGLRVAPVKAAHENELANSILPRVATPSDAVEVLRSYAVAHRSRRTTLARLAEKYSNSLFMEPLADGGYIIKCANLLEVTWTLENKWSPVAPFHHRMKFDLEYMDEMYVKIISQAHRELSDPTLETDERTRLMSKIIATCLEAQGPTQELYESIESDKESENLRKRRTTLDEEMEEPINKKKKDSEIMAPPKSLPKKTKPKGKENNANNRKDSKSVKRSVTDSGEDGAKKAKLSNGNAPKNNNINSKHFDKEVPALKKVTDNKISNINDNNSVKTNVDKENKKTVTEKIVSKSKNSDKDPVVKDIVPNSKNLDKENIATLKKGSSNKAAIVKKSDASSQLHTDKKNNINTKQSTDMFRSDKDSAASKKIRNEQNLKGKSVHEKLSVDPENTNKVDSIKKPTKKPNMPTQEAATESNNVNNNNKENKANIKASNKKPGNMPNQDAAKDSNNVNNNKNTKVKKLPKNVETNTKVTQNDETAKVSSQKKIASKEETSKAPAKVSNKNLNPKTKLNDNVKENVANIGDGLVTDNTNKKSVIKTKSTENVNTAKPRASNSENLKSKSNPNLNKIVNNYDKRSVNTNKGDKNIKSTSKESVNSNEEKNNPISKLNKPIAEKDKKKHVSQENPTNSASNNKGDTIIKSTSKELVNGNEEKNNPIKKSNKPTVEKEKKQHLSKENPTNSASNNKNVKSHLIKEKAVNKHDSAHTKIKEDVIQLKTVEKNLNAKPKTDKILDKNDKANMREENNVENVVDKVSKKFASVEKKIPKDLNEKHVSKINKNTNSNLIKHASKQIQHDNINSDTKKTKPNFNLKNIAKTVTITNNMILRKSKSPIQKSKIKLLNARNKISLNKPKVTEKHKDGELQNEDRDKNKIITKIPQLHDKVLKKNPLRISPRKMQSNLKTDSQNSSRTSQRSLQKPMTGIPRLLKKPIR